MIESLPLFFNMAKDLELLRNTFVALPFIAKVLCAIVVGMLIGGLVVLLVRGGRSLREKLRHGSHH